MKPTLYRRSLRSLASFPSRRVLYASPVVSAPKKRVTSTPTPADAPAPCPCQSFFPLIRKATTVPNVLFIGGGNMAQATSKALRNLYPADKVAVVDVNTAALSHFAQLGHPTFATTKAALQKFKPEVIYLAVKPPYYEDVAKTLHGKVGKDCIVISMVLGVTLDQMAESFNTRKVVRIMPNTNSAVQRGATIWAVLPAEDGETLTTQEEATVKEQLMTMGYTVKIPHEGLIDAATAVAGSGPAYYLLLMEAATDAGVHLGLPRQTAQELVYSTILGTVLRAESSTSPLPVLKQQVATPAGATMAALYKLEQGGLRTLIADAMWAAYRRTLQVGGKQTLGVGPDRAE